MSVSWITNLINFFLPPLTLNFISTHYLLYSIVFQASIPEDAQYHVIHNGHLAGHCIRHCCAACARRRTANNGRACTSVQRGGASAKAWVLFQIYWWSCGLPLFSNTPRRSIQIDYYVLLHLNQCRVKGVPRSVWLKFRIFLCSDDYEACMRSRVVPRLI